MSTRAQRRQQLADLVASVQADEHSAAGLAMALDVAERNGWTVTDEHQAHQLDDPRARRLTLTRLDKLAQLGLAPIIDRAQKDGWVLLAAVDGTLVVVRGNGRGRPRQIPEPVRRRILREHHTGKTPWQIAHDLNTDGIPAARSNHWRDSTIRTIIQTQHRPPTPTRSRDQAAAAASARMPE